MSEVYDLGNKEVKVLKARENQSKEIKGLPVSALFVGSPANILYDEAIKHRFKVEFSTKLARRSWFCFVPQTIEETRYSTVDELLAAEEAIENEALEARKFISEGIKYITEQNLAKSGTLLEVSPEVRKLFTIYKRYNTELAETIPKLYTISVLVRKHLQWKALKLSGALAIFNEHDTIELEDYIEAIRFAELLDKDMQMFENELVKEPYEVFADYMKSIAENGKASLSVHALRKLGYISTLAGKSDTKLKDLCHLAASYDQTGLYKVTAHGIDYEAILPVSEFTIVLKPVDNTPIFNAISTKASPNVLKMAKHTVASTANSGLEEHQCNFSDLAELLKGDFAYSPFRFKDGIRNKDTILPGTKLLVLDIDDSTITAEEAHFLLEDINHHIALTADPDNQFKFRVLLELDSVVDVDPVVWKYFYQSIADSLSLKVDPLPQSQLFYSYSTSPVWSVVDAKPIPVRNHVMVANDKVADKPVIEKPLTAAQVTAAISDPFTTFHYAYECPNDGTGSRTLMRAAYHARDLGMAKEDIIHLIQQIVDYWVSGFPEDRLEKTILSQIRRFKWHHICSLYLYCQRTLPCSI